VSYCRSKITQCVPLSSAGPAAGMICVAENRIAQIQLFSKRIAQKISPADCWRSLSAGRKIGQRSQRLATDSA
jgi:hypothetical protein